MFQMGTPVIYKQNDIWLEWFYWMKSILYLFYCDLLRSDTKHRYSFKNLPTYWNDINVPIALKSTSQTSYR